MIICQLVRGEDFPNNYAIQAMRVLLDAAPLASVGAGLARYVSELSLSLSRCFPDDAIRLISDQRFRLPEGAGPNLSIGHSPRNHMERRWWLWGVAGEALRFRAGVFHGTNFEVPLLPMLPTVLSLADLSPWSDAEWADAQWRMLSERVRERAAPLIMLGVATIVMTYTEAVRREAIERFRLHPARVVSVPLAASARFHPRPVPITTQRYFLFVGTAEPRKNIPILIEAWREVRRRYDVDLVLAGGPRPGYDLPTEPGLRTVGAVAEDELATLYSSAVACLYPSLYEGFGLPPLEAMQSGCPAVVSRQASISEVTAGGALQLDATDARSWAEAMEALLSSNQLRMAWRERGLRRAAEFSWDATARKTREVYEEAQRRF